MTVNASAIDKTGAGEHHTRMQIDMRIPNEKCAPISLLRTVLRVFVCREINRGAHYSDAVAIAVAIDALRAQ